MISVIKNDNTAPKEKKKILTFIKHRFKRYLWKELVDPSYDVWLTNTRSISIPDLNDIFSVSYTNADSNYFILCKKKKK